MSGKVVLVTGASSGIGGACAEMLAKRGFRVYGSSRNPNFRPSGYQALQMDVTDDKSVDEAVAQVIREAGSIDALVNNAGCGLAGAVEDTASVEALHQMDVNFMGPFRAVRAVLPGMRQRRSGVIVNVSSLGGLLGLPFQSFYSASKFAMEGWTESLRFEVSPLGIRVVLIEPGDYDTDIWERNLVIGKQALDASSPNKERSQRFAEFVKSRTPKRRDPREVAQLIVRVANDPNPRLRYLIGPDVTMQMWLRALLPWRRYERVVAKATRID